VLHGGCDVRCRARPASGIADVQAVVVSRALRGEPAGPLHPGEVRRLSGARRLRGALLDDPASCAGRGSRRSWADPSFGIGWSADVVVINDREHSNLDFDGSAA
jgi:hypothetical protein